MSRAGPAITIVIPCFRHTAELRRCLAGVAGQQAGIGFEVVVVDSAPDAEVARTAAEARGRRGRPAPDPRGARSSSSWMPTACLSPDGSRRRTWRSRVRWFW